MPDPSDQTAHWARAPEAPHRGLTRQPRVRIASPRRPRQQTVLAALAPPLEWRIMAVVVAAGIVPVDAERVDVAACALRQSQLCTYRMSDVLEVHRLDTVRAGHPLYCLVQDIGNRDGSPIAAAFNLDCPGFDAEEVTDEGTECSHRAASLSASN